MVGIIPIVGVYIYIHLMVSPNMIQQLAKNEPRSRLEEEQNGMLRLPVKSTELGRRVFFSVLIQPWYHWLKEDFVYSLATCSKSQTVKTN